ncbi:MAG: nucleoside recognition domain-containing protein [Bacilli bacterium]
MFDFFDYIKTSLIDSIYILLEMALIIFIVMLIIELLKTFKILDKINGYSYKFTKYLGITKSANFPLIVGVLIGISYGAGAIITSYNQNDMTKKDVILVSVFLCICHALIEDTLLFARVGANILIIVFVRVFVAITCTIVVNKIITTKERKNKYESN